MIGHQQILPDLVQAMSEPGFYTGSTRSVELRQTHISYVFLTDEYVFKVKKPVRFSFLDYSTLDKRLQYCEDEVRLNRRLAPAVYLGIVTIRKSGGRFFLGEEETQARGQVVEYAVKMRRLDEARILDRLVVSGDAGSREMHSIARKVAGFHASAPSGRAAQYGGPSTIWDRIENNFKETEAFASITHGHDDRLFLWDYSRHYFADHRRLLEERVKAERVREGHGDLRAEHVHVSPEGTISIFDCVEFSESLRTCDGVSEIAFLAMDLDFLRAHELSRELVAAYADEASDPQVHELLPFYATYRALVRAKVEGLKSAEHEISEDDRATARLRARRYFDLAVRYARGPRSPAILAVCGMAGTGKSTMARRLSDRTGFPTFNSDIVRKQLAGIEPTSPVNEAFEGGIYSHAFTEKTYAALASKAEQTVAEGKGVIVDATFGNPAHRRLLQSSAESHNVPLLFIECTAPEKEIRRRLEARAQRPEEVSDATWDVYERRRNAFTPLSELPERYHLRVRTDENLDQALHRIDELLEKRT